MKKKCLLALASLALGLLCAGAQQRTRVVMPQCNPDGSVTFSLRAPQANSVELSGQFQKQNQPMQKGEDGVWTITVTPDSADIYPYNYVVDGVAIQDPCNAYIFPNENFKASILEMPNPKAAYTVRNVPHGKVEYRDYFSTVLGEYRPVLVYTPAEYESNPGKEYPVFYLISGTTDTEETWYKVGRANTIIDNLIAQGEAKPMIVVMPYGYMNQGNPAPNTMEAVDMYKTFNRELTECIMPFVESNYRTIRDKDHRAIAGFSRGGGQSMFSALSNPDKIGYLAIYSAYLMPEVMEKEFPNLKEDVNGLSMCWFCVGDDDFLYKDVVRNKEYFNQQGIRYTSTPHLGSHTWMHARFALEESAKQLFKKPDQRVGDAVVDNRTFPGWTIFRPVNIAESVAAQGLMPIVVFGNGACSHDSSYYVPMLANMAEQGYLVIAVGEDLNPNNGVHHDFSSIGQDVDLVDAIDWACKANANPESEYYRMVDTGKVALSGHSCGGAQAMAASYDPRVSTTIMFNSGMGNMQMAGASSSSLANLHAPVLYLIGGPEDIAYGNAEIDFTRINDVPVVVANFPVGHGGTYGDPQGGVLGDVAMQWLDWQLRGKKSASTFFNNPAWREKQYPTCDYKQKR